jgi:hypothetical protein
LHNIHPIELAAKTYLSLENLASGCPRYQIDLIYDGHKHSGENRNVQNYGQYPGNNHVAWWRASHADGVAKASRRVDCPDR